jgi:fatty-acyl-CoA synthase
VLPALPMTAIGKVYKPALRLLAIEARLREDLAGLGRPVAVAAQERGGTLVAVLTVAGADDPALRAAVQDRLGAMALRLEFVFA